MPTCWKTCGGYNDYGSNNKSFQSRWVDLFFDNFWHFWTDRPTDWPPDRPTRWVLEAPSPELKNCQNFPPTDRPTNKLTPRSSVQEFINLVIRIKKSLAPHEKRTPDTPNGLFYCCDRVVIDLLVCKSTILDNSRLRENGCVVVKRLVGLANWWFHLWTGQKTNLLKEKVSRGWDSDYHMVCPLQP